MSDKCIFTEDIGGNISCSSIEDNFDEYGFPIIPCKFYPCDKLKDIIKDIIKETDKK